jgi:lysophospholipase L1-like esterase
VTAVRGALLVVVVLLGALAPASAGGQAPPPVPPPPPPPPAPLLGLNSTAGGIDLAMLAPRGASVQFAEEVDGARVPLATVPVDDEPTAFTSAKLLRAAAWRCDRVERRFVAVATAPDGSTTEATAETRTPDCRDRLDVRVPRRVRKAGVLTVVVRDRWTTGRLTATACARRMGGPRRCLPVTLAGGQQAGVVRFRVGRDSVWEVRTRYEGTSILRVLTVGQARRPEGVDGLPRLLVTGDSLIQGLDAFVADRLQTAYEVISDSRPGTGVVKPIGTDWRVIARQQIAEHHQAVTVASLGINDGFPITLPDRTVACCDKDWVGVYAGRVGAMMDRYRQGGRARVLWIVAPVPRDPRFAAVARSVNAGILRAARTRRDVRLVRLDTLLTPGGRYVETLPVAGRPVRVRAPDGVHLSVAGARLAAALIAGIVRDG